GEQRRLRPAAPVRGERSELRQRRRIRTRDAHGERVEHRPLCALHRRDGEIVEAGLVREGQQLFERVHQSLWTMPSSCISAFVSWSYCLSHSTNSGPSWCARFKPTVASLSRSSGSFSACFAAARSLPV